MSRDLSNYFFLAGLLLPGLLLNNFLIWWLSFEKDFPVFTPYGSRLFDSLANTALGLLFAFLVAAIVLLPVFILFTDEYGGERP